jgi:hypothetical protein
MDALDCFALNSCPYCNEPLDPGSKWSTHNYTCLSCSNSSIVYVRRGQSWLIPSGYFKPEFGSLDQVCADADVERRVVIGLKSLNTVEFVDFYIQLRKLPSSDHDAIRQHFQSIQRERLPLHIKLSSFLPEWPPVSHVIFACLLLAWLIRLFSGQ